MSTEDNRPPRPPPYQPPDHATHKGGLLKILHSPFHHKKKAGGQSQSSDSSSPPPQPGVSHTQPPSRPPPPPQGSPLLLQDIPSKHSPLPLHHATTSVPLLANAAVDGEDLKIAPVSQAPPTLIAPDAVEGARAEGREGREGHGLDESTGTEAESQDDGMGVFAPGSVQSSLKAAARKHRFADFFTFHRHPKMPTGIPASPPPSKPKHHRATAKGDAHMRNCLACDFGSGSRTFTNNNSQLFTSTTPPFFFRSLENTKEVTVKNLGSPLPLHELSKWLVHTRAHIVIGAFLALYLIVGLVFSTLLGEHTMRGWMATTVVMMSGVGMGEVEGGGPWLGWQVMMMVGMALRVLVIGLFFIRFRRPVSRIRFSRWCVVTDNGVSSVRSLEFRIANECWKEDIVNAQVSVVLAFNPRTGPPRRRFLNLALLTHEQVRMPYVWTISHVVDAQSPLYRQSWQNLSAQNMEIKVLVSGIEANSMDDIVATHTYKMGYTLFDAEFVPLVPAGTCESSETIVMDFAFFDHVRAKRPVNVHSFA